MIAFDFTALDAETLCRALGLVGFSLYVIAFTGLGTGRLSSEQPLYFVIVLTAASSVLASLWVDFNLPSALIQIFYVIVSITAIFIRRDRWGMSRATPQQ